MVSTTKNIGGVDYVIHPFPALQVINFEFQIAPVIIPVITGLLPLLSDLQGNNKNIMDLDISMITGGIMQGLGAMKPETFLKFAIDMLSKTYLRAGGELLTEAKINDHFQGRIKDIYLLIFEVMKANKFSFFELGAGGIGMGITNISEKSDAKTTDTQKK